MSTTKQISRAVRRALMLSVGAAAATAASLPAMGQAAPAPAPESAQVETIVITGSRIPQPQLESVSPVTSINNVAIQQSGVTRVEDLLNTLPQVAGQYGAGLSNGATGEATVSLRGLGANRTMVLVNGRRLMPGDPTLNGNAAPDLNQIPAGLVERVDLLTGGASAVYGADAVAGVVNFVINDHFQGVRFEGNYNFYQHDNRDNSAQAANKLFGFTPPSGNSTDGYARDFNVIAGSNFAEGRGNATAYAGYRRVAAVLQAKRDYSNCSLTSTTTGGVSTLGCGGSTTSFVARFNNPGQINPATGKVSTMHFDPATGDAVFGSPPLYNFAPLNYYQRPDERYTAGAFVHYDVNDHARIYSEFMFMDDRSIAQIAPSGAFPGAGPAATATGIPDGTFLINCDNPFLTTTELHYWCADSTSSPPAHVALRRRNVEGGPRYDDLGHTSYRAVFGVKGDITDAWSYDAYGLWGTTRYSEEYFNDVSKARMAAALDAVKLTNGQIVCAANASGVIGAPGCVPWNIFSNIGGGVTPAAVQYLSIPGESKGATTERVLDGAVTGDLGKLGVKLPTAHDGLGVSVGAEYRSEASELNPDITFQINDLAGQGSPTLPTIGSLHVAEIFAEARLPLVEDKPFAKSLTFETGYRYSDYNLSFGSTNTYKAGLQWAPVSDLRVRGMYQRAVRAPNLQELFLQPRVQLDGTIDPCANSAATGLPTATAAQCALTGVTAAEYGNIARNPAAQYNGLAGGNVNLAPEKADTYTVGLVLTPKVLPDFNLTLDYYNITIKNLISTYGANLILQTCIGTAEPLYCNKIHRTQGTGTVADGSLWINTDGYISDTNFNLGSQRANGIDVTSQYRLDFGRAGRLGFDFVGSYVLKFTTEPVTGLGSYDCAGYYGQTCGVPDPRWRHKLRATWNTPVSGLDLYTSWRRINGATLELLNPSPLLQGTPGLPVNPGVHLSGRDYVDLGGSYTFRGHATFRMGINNLFDKSPPLVGFAYIGTVFGNGNTYPQVYDALGRYAFFNVTVDF
jgi:outer membrane receptor protein involved in Fe transport